MKHANLKKAVEKFAIVRGELGKNDVYKARYGRYVIQWTVTWYQKEEQEASLVRVYHVNDKDEIQSDYVAGSYYDTIKSAVKAFTYDLHKEIC